jgi:hypothetical protein
MGDRAQVAAPATSDRASWEPGKGNVATVGQVEERVLEHGGWLATEAYDPTAIVRRLLMVGTFDGGLDTRMVFF